MNGSFDDGNESMSGDFIGDGMSTDDRLVKFQRPRDFSSNGYTKDQTLGQSVISPEKASNFNLSF
jgi:hypothetical protein